MRRSNLPAPDSRSFARFGAGRRCLSPNFSLVHPNRLTAKVGHTRSSTTATGCSRASFAPRMRTYVGREVPRPLVIDIDRGDAQIETVLADIMALTKLN